MHWKGGLADSLAISQNTDVEKHSIWADTDVDKHSIWDVATTELFCTPWASCPIRMREVGKDDEAGQRTDLSSKDVRRNGASTFTAQVISYPSADSCLRSAKIPAHQDAWINLR